MNSGDVYVLFKRPKDAQPHMKCAFEGIGETSPTSYFAKRSLSKMFRCVYNGALLAKTFHRITKRVSARYHEKSWKFVEKIS